MNHLLTGLILDTKKTKIRKHWPNCSPPNCQIGCRYKQESYKMKVMIENKPIKFISVFKDKIVQKDKILKILENNEFVDKRYLFTCVPYYGNYHLIDLKELPNK